MKSIEHLIETLRQQDTKPLLNKKIAIIGGGVSGCSSAVLLESLGATVQIFEQSDRFFEGASAWGWGRFHFGQNSIDVLDGRESAPHTSEFVNDILKKDMFMHSVLKPFLLTDKERPHYYLDKKRWDSHQVEKSLQSLENIYTNIASSSEPGLNKKYYQIIENDKHQMQRPDPLVGVSSNEMPIDVAALAASLQLKMSNPGITKHMNTKVISAHKKDDGFTLTCFDKMAQTTTHHSADFIVNAGWAAGHQLDDPLGLNNIMYRSTLYLIVNGVTKTEPGTYMSILGDDQINFFHIADDKAVLEAQSISNFNTTNLPKRQDAWGDTINQLSKNQDERDRLKSILAACKQAMPNILGMLNESNIEGGFYAEGWNKYTPGIRSSDNISCEAYRTKPKQGYFALSSEKIPLALYSSFQVAFDICTAQNGCDISTLPDLRDAFAERMKLAAPSSQLISTLLPLDPTRPLSIMSVYIASHHNRALQQGINTANPMFQLYKSNSPAIKQPNPTTEETKLRV